MKALTKDRVYEIIKTKTRFLSIMSLVALGVFVYTGLKATGPNMRATLDSYYNALNMQDMSVQSTLGLDDEDRRIIDSTKSVEDADYGYITDCYLNEDREVLRIQSESMNMNYYKILKGRNLEKKGEILLDDKLRSFGYDLEQSLRVEFDEKSESVLKSNEFKIVGFVKSPEYISKQIRGKTNIGSGDIFAYGIVKEENFDSPVYSVAWIKFKNTRNLKTYSEEYKTVMKNNSKEMKDRLKGRPELRFSSVMREASSKIEDAERKLRSAREELENSKRKLDDAKSQIEYGDSQLKTEKKRASEEFSKGEEGLSDGRVALKSADSKLQAGEILSAVGENRSERLKKDIESSRNSLIAAKSELDNLEMEIAEYRSRNLDEFEKTELDNRVLKHRLLIEQYNLNMDELGKAESELEQNERDISEGKAQLQQGKESYQEGWNNVFSGSNKLFDSKLFADREFGKAEDELEVGKKKYEAGLKEYKEKAPDAEKQISEGEEEIEKAKESLSEIKVPKYIINTRADDINYYQYIDNAKRIDLLSNVFPIFFFTIAMLVSLTTMTRMVDEQRGLMGTLKALGYSSLEIGKKFIIYGLISGMIGIFIGSIVGETTLPKLIAEAYTVPFNINENILKIYPLDIAIASAISLFSTSGAAYLVARKDLGEKASELMRPKVPVSGSRILFERITPIWKRLSFIQKVTARNVFRYKKRMIMTVFGVAGCTALIFMGIGIHSSISGIAEKQYSELFKYDAIAIYNTEEEGNEVLYDNAIEELKGIKNSMKMQLIRGRVEDEDLGTEDSDIFIVSDKKKFNHFVKLRDRKRGDIYSLSDDGVFITEKVASIMKIKLGDKLSIEIDDEKYDMNVSGITENYAGQYIYMTDKYYEKLFNKPYKENAYMIMAKDNSDSSMEEMSKEIMNNKSAMAVLTTSYIRSVIDSMLESMGIIVSVILACGGLLAIVVLYNLTNINVSERERELSTIKVLGFYDKEVTSYVYRETLILTTMGIVAGFGAGKLLHRYVLKSVEPASVMMDPSTKWFGFVISAAVTIGISFVVMYIIHNKLKKINMIESLKSVE